MTFPKMFRQGGFAALCILAATCISASAADLMRCQGISRESHALDSNYQDLGNGYVSYYYQQLNFFDQPSSSSGAILIEACASGKIIYAPVYYCVYGADGDCEKKSSYDFRDEAIAMLDQAAGSEPTTFDALATRFKKISPDTSVRPASEAEGESCACHVAYPRLRGSKEKFRFPKY